MRLIDLSESLDLQDVLDVAHGLATAVVGPLARSRMEASRAVVDAFVADPHVPRYGINTGFGALAEVVIPAEQVTELQHNLVRSHACGVGPLLPTAVVRAMMLLRAHVLAKGFSGVRPEVAELLCAMLTAGIHPVVPSQGSVGASGDLAPLAHLALVLIGEGQADWQGQLLPGHLALAEAGLAPLVLGAKEGLALINGTQAMTALAVLALERADRLCETADIAGALTVEAQLATDKAFDARIVAVRPHEGARQVADHLRELTANSPLIASHAGPHDKKVQDPYSIRCMPQVHGTVRDAMGWLRHVLMVDVDAVTDNPLIFVDPDGDPAKGAILSGGNFHGQPVSLACDAARAALTALASMSERRIEQLVNPALNTGLPAFLAARSGLHSGLMMAQVTASALVSEAKGLSFPASVDSIPSSANREDHVSMGPIAARRLLDVLSLAEQVVAIEVVAACQGIDLRAPLQPGPVTGAVHQRVRESVAFLDADRVLQPDLELAAQLVRTGALVDAARAASASGR